MYLELFNLVDKPFQLTPDTDYLYLSNSHARAMAYMDYSVWNQEGFVVITGEVGAGKTLLVHKLLSELTSNVVVAKLFQTQLNETEFLQAMLVEFGLNPFNAQKVELMDMLNSFLIESYADSKQTVLLVDDAQNLDERVLEEIRMLSNLEIKKEKILHIILVGQPELNKTLEKPELEQLLQRVRLRFHVNPLNLGETGDYMLHRLRIAGSGSREIFATDSYDLIHKFTGGLPRLINTLCDTALMCAYADDVTLVSKEIIQTAIDELHWQPYRERQERMEKQRKSTLTSRSKLKGGAELSNILDRNTNALEMMGSRLENLDALISPLSLMVKKLASIENLLINFSRNPEKNRAIKQNLDTSVRKVTNTNSNSTVSGTKNKSGAI